MKDGRDLLMSALAMAIRKEDPEADVRFNPDADWSDRLGVRINDKPEVRLEWMRLERDDSALAFYARAVSVLAAIRRSRSEGEVAREVQGDSTQVLDAVHLLMDDAERRDVTKWELQTPEGAAPYQPRVVGF